MTKRKRQKTIQWPKEKDRSQYNDQKKKTGEENVKAQCKGISKGTKDDYSPTESITLHNPCGYPEEEISHPKEKQEEEKEAI
jgi:hypothetical protein